MWELATNVDTEDTGGKVLYDFSPVSPVSAVEESLVAPGSRE